ncbi:MAG: bifunctional methylenetetrahydrofolate dehydrogenase/methenyltetrahydrofolate cyclohydrolase FolD [Burkholderiaceae bacterium]|jgi:methylenetetrahydrofolate dehydrogenase (NADP+)/methenyltetrahydrofolate cyclohydrolase|nr:bifunctional methylenetetrahydrofolate dehydrogenase/methenyltetrahydrofolate cyclohydrolase FolD [Burkholderiaceae bacterium]
MSAKILDGAALAKSIRADVAQRAAKLATAGRTPGLAVILVGDDPGSAIYVRNKVKDCEEAGIRSTLDRLPASTTQQALLARIRALNEDDSIDGILVQLPLPPQIDPFTVIETISPTKDVDGFHVASAGALMTGQPGFRPCTPYGVMRLLEQAGAQLRGAEAVVVGRSNIVGKPQALLLLAADATVTVCHSRTRDLAAHTRRADILVAAVGRARMITGDMIKPGAIIIDVGMNRDENGKLCGDVDFDSASRVASWITPVPGGVGPMTRAMLLVNTIEAAERKQESNDA